MDYCSVEKWGQPENRMGSCTRGKFLLLFKEKVDDDSRYRLQIRKFFRCRQTDKVISKIIPTVETWRATSLQTKFGCVDINLFRLLAAHNVLGLKGLFAAKIHLLLKKEKEFTAHTMYYKIHIVCGCFG